MKRFVQFVQLMILFLIIGLGAASFAPGSVQAVPPPTDTVGAPIVVVEIPAPDVPDLGECPTIIADSGGDLTPPTPPDDTAPILVADSGGD